MSAKSYQVFARVYRPKQFSELIGQDSVAISLKNSILRDRVAHAYLFSGARGVGKTTVARIFSMALNCEDPTSVEPCGVCPTCLSIKAGKSLHVYEIDGASNNGVESIRELIESARFSMSASDKYKIYIIDEVHMLSISAFNALLKTLEEPVANTIFILATTEPHKIPETVLSRCQKYEFKLLSAKEICNHLVAILADQNIEFDESAVKLIARLAEGSVRDALSLLDRAVAASENKISLIEVEQCLGIISREKLFSLVQMVLNQEVNNSLISISQLSSFDAEITIREFVAVWRELLLGRYLGSSGLVNLGLTEDESNFIYNLASTISSQEIQQLYDLVRDSSDKALKSLYPWFAFEALIVRLATRGERTLGKEESTRVVNSNSLRLTEAQNLQQPLPQTQIPSGSESNPVVKDNLELSWSDFITFCNNQPGNKLVVGTLKEAKILEFELGKVVLTGSAEVTNALRSSMATETLNKLLASFANHFEWEFIIESKGTKSLSKDERGDISGNILNNLISVFPNSQINSG